MLDKDQYEVIMSEHIQHRFDSIENTILSIISAETYEYSKDVDISIKAEIEVLKEIIKQYNTKFLNEDLSDVTKEELESHLKKIDSSIRNFISTIQKTVIDNYIKDSENDLKEISAYYKANSEPPDLTEKMIQKINLSYQH